MNIPHHSIRFSQIMRSALENEIYNAMLRNSWGVSWYSVYVWFSKVLFIIEEDLKANGWYSPTSRGKTFSAILMASQ